MPTHAPNDNAHHDASGRRGARRPEGGDGPPTPVPEAEVTTEREWQRALEQLPEQRWPPRDVGGELVVVAPHPDDESLGVGGLIHLSLQAGWRVEIVTVTDGDAAHGEPNQLLGKRRRREQARAAEELAGATAPRLVIDRLGVPDGQVARHEAELEDDLVDHLLGADWCFTTSRADGHPDHEATGRAAVTAAREVGIPLAEYPIWAWHWRTPDSFPMERAVRVELPASSRAAKASAIAQHVSQLQPYGDQAGPILPPDVLAHFDRPFEVLLLP